jgi:hypothetical protein
VAKANIGKSQSVPPSSSDRWHLPRWQSVAAKRSKKLKRPVSPEVASLPSRLETARLLYGITGNDLDAKAGIGGGRTCRIQKRERIEGLPLDTVIKLANALDVRPAWLALGEEPMRSETRGVRPKFADLIQKAAPSAEDGLVGGKILGQDAPTFSASGPVAPETPKPASERKPRSGNSSQPPPVEQGRKRRSRRE